MATRVEGRFEPSARLTPANGITLLRICATPLAVAMFVRFGVSWATFAVWVVLASTDFLDGWVARRQGSTTSGAFLDPLADKVLVLGVLFALAAGSHVSWAPVVILASREISMSIYRSVVARRGISVPARPLAKAKTAAEDISIGLIVMPLTAGSVAWLGQGLLWVAVFLALASACQYLLDSRARAAATPSRTR